MAKRIALGWSAASFSLALLCMLIDHPASAWAFSLLAATLPPALIAVGASRDGRLGPLAGTAFGLTALMALVVFLLLWFEGQSQYTVFGFPFSIISALVGLWLLPLILTTAAYAATFDDLGLREEDLRKIRRLRKDRERSGKSGNGEGVRGS